MGFNVKYCTLLHFGYFLSRYVKTEETTSVYLNFSLRISEYSFMTESLAVKILDEYSSYIYSVGAALSLTDDCDHRSATKNYCS